MSAGLSLPSDIEVRVRVEQLSSHTVWHCHQCGAARDITAGWEPLANVVNVKLCRGCSQIPRDVHLRASGGGRAKAGELDRFRGEGTQYINIRDRVTQASDVAGAGTWWRAGKVYKTAVWAAQLCAETYQSEFEELNVARATLATTARDNCAVLFGDIETGESAHIVRRVAALAVASGSEYTGMRDRTWVNLIDSLMRGDSFKALTWKIQHSRKPWKNSSGQDQTEDLIALIEQAESIFEPGAGQKTVVAASVKRFLDTGLTDITLTAFGLYDVANLYNNGRDDMVVCAVDSVVAQWWDPKPDQWRTRGVANWPSGKLCEILGPVVDGDTAATYEAATRLWQDQQSCDNLDSALVLSSARAVVR